MVTSPVVLRVDVVLIAPVVLMIVEPVITEAPLMVPVVIAALVRVLFERVSVARRVAITPDDGKVAVELIPVPPFDLPSRPATAEDEARLRLPN